MWKIVYLHTYDKLSNMWYGTFIDDEVCYEYCVWFNDKLHNEHGPAHIDDDEQTFYIHGKIHRVNGPAVFGRIVGTGCAYSMSMHNNIVKKYGPNTSVIEYWHNNNLVRADDADVTYLKDSEIEEYKKKYFFEVSDINDDIQFRTSTKF